MHCRRNLVQGLEDATPAQLAEVEVLGAGGGLHWETLDVDLSVPGLFNGVFGGETDGGAGRAHALLRQGGRRAGERG